MLSKQTLGDTMTELWFDIVKAKKKKLRRRKTQRSGKKQDACYYKVRSRYKKWPSAYASGALVQCRKVGAANWGNSVKKANPLKTWFEQEAEGEDGETVSGWVSCQSCEDDKKGVKPCGRESASKGTKQRCRATCAKCKSYPRRKGKS